MQLFKKACLNNRRTHGSFNLPISIGTLSVDNALLDLGASINLIPLAMLKKIVDLKIQPKMTLHDLFGQGSCATCRKRH